jgi:hypothetical protein
MKQNYPIITLLCIFFCSLSAFSQSSFWKATTNTSNNAIQKSKVINPTTQSLFEFNVEDFKKEFNRTRGVVEQRPVLLSFPTPEGNVKQYNVVEAPVLEPSFQAKFPNILTYRGQGVTNPQETIRFTVTKNGLHAIVLGTEKGIQYVNPIAKGSTTHSFFYRNDNRLEQSDWECGVIDEVTDGHQHHSHANRNADDGLMRTFRIAIAGTAEYSNFHGDTVEEVVAAMTIAVTRINAVIERDLSITLQMVDNTEIIFFDPIRDQLDNFDNGALLGQAQTLIATEIGIENYDIAHVFNTAGGGVAYLGVSCEDNFNSGVSGDGTPEGQVFEFIFAHELGHQLGSPHSFNANGGSCGPNRSGANAYEPGSGSTIMAYPGLCGDQNLPVGYGMGDMYYHQGSLSFMWNHIEGSGACPTDQVSTGNSPVTVDAGMDYTIPQGTPYKLTGSSEDADGTESHTYTWEQFDLGPAGAPTEATLQGPLVRSFPGTTNPTRYIPNLADLGLSPGSSDWEKLATVDRDVNFRLTVRDNDARGGQTSFDAMTVSVTTAAGPFRVTSHQFQNQIVWAPGSTETITWDVAGTDANGINESSVNILLSTDGGVTYDTVLASNVPNNGSYDIQVPNISAPRCRVMVESVNNIFFNINDAFFAIGDYTYSEQCEDYTFNLNTTIPENSNFYTVYNINVPDELLITDLDIEVNISGEALNSDLIFGVRGPFGTGTVNELSRFYCPDTTDINWIFDDQGDPIDCNSTNNGDRVIPEDPLSFANNQGSQGMWDFLITDIGVDGLTSDLNSVTLKICSVIPVENTLSVNSEDWVGLQIFPNPNNGNFNVNFTPQSGENIEIQLYDLLGREVYSREFESTGDFSESISLNSSVSGIYLLKIKDGQRSITRKIVMD